MSVSCLMVSAVNPAACFLSIADKTEHIHSIFADHPARSHLVERHAAAQEVAAVEAAQHDIGVGHGGARAAQAISRRSRHGASRTRSNLEGAGLVDEGN